MWQKVLASQMINGGSWNQCSQTNLIVSARGYFLHQLHWWKVDSRWLEITLIFKTNQIYPMCRNKQTFVIYKHNCFQDMMRIVNFVQKTEGFSFSLFGGSGQISWRFVRINDFDFVGPNIKQQILVWVIGNHNIYISEQQSFLVNAGFIL